MSMIEVGERGQRIKPHCPECGAVIETVGAGHYTEGSLPFWVIFCQNCGASLGVHFDRDPDDTAPKHPVQEIADAVGGTIKEMSHLPDGSGFAIMSMPLPKTHWIYNQDGSIGAGPAPMPFRMGRNDEAIFACQRPGEPVPEIMNKERLATKIRVAAKYAIRASTMCGKEMDFDPDAMVQNMVVAMLGYWTETGLSSDAWENPSTVQ